MIKISIPDFVTSHDFRGDAEYVAWLQEIKSRYQRIRSRTSTSGEDMALSEFNWTLGREFLVKKAEQRWGCAGVVEQLSLDMRTEYPYIKGFLIANPMVYEAMVSLLSWRCLAAEKLHQAGVVQSIEIRTP